MAFLNYIPTGLRLTNRVRVHGYTAPGDTSAHSECTTLLYVPPPLNA